MVETIIETSISIIFLIGVLVCVFGGGLLLGLFIWGTFNLWWKIYRVCKMTPQMRKTVKILNKRYNKTGTVFNNSDDTE